MGYQHIHLGRPNEPANLTTSNVTTTGVDLAWDSVAGANQYKVFQIDEDDTITEIATPATATYSVTGLTSATTYSFYVTAVDTADTDADNESGPSNTVTITTS